MRDLLVARANDDNVALVIVEATWTWAEHVAESSRRAHWLLSQRRTDSPFHIGLLGGNSAEFSFWLGACALAGAVAVGLNPTRSDVELARDAVHADCLVVLADVGCMGRAARIHDAGVPVAAMSRPGSAIGHRELPCTVPDAEVTAGDLLALIFTSGTTTDPKAVQCSHGRLAHSGAMVGLMNELVSGDVVLVTMPMFHSNAIIAGWIPAMSVGASMVLGDFSARGFVAALRERGVTYANYVGKTLSYALEVPQVSGDGDLPLRAIFGNEASETSIHDFALRFGCKVTDAYGSTEGGISLMRTDDTPRGSLGVAVGDVRVLAEDGNECPRAVIDERGHKVNLDEAIGELVNSGGRGGFEGYWKNDDADAARVRSGRFHSGDLAWRDEAGFFWFAGRTGEWLRVDGENLAVAPIERVLAEYPGVLDVAVVAVADPVAGDQILACLEMADPGAFEAASFADWCERRDDLGAKELPRHVHVCAALPRTPTNKVKRVVVRQMGLAVQGPLWSRHGRDTHFTPTKASRALLADPL
ncbi:MAG: fatty-acyl-CoA synthase [Glaciecola sp.]